MKTLINTLFAAVTLTVFSFTATQAKTHKPIGRPQKVATFQTSLYTTQAGKLQLAVKKETGVTVMFFEK